MNKKKKKPNIILIALVFLVIGFFAGQFLAIPALDDYNLFASMSSPGSHHKE